MLGVPAVTLAWIILWKLPNNPWLIGAFFGWMVLIPVMIVFISTIPRGRVVWKDYWRYYELKNRLSLRFVTPVYVLLCILGIVSTIFVLMQAGSGE
jgi:hypothetical protein